MTTIEGEPAAAPRAAAAELDVGPTPRSWPGLLARIGVQTQPRSTVDPARHPWASPSRLRATFAYLALGAEVVATLGPMQRMHGGRFVLALVALLALVAAWVFLISGPGLARERDRMLLLLAVGASGLGLELVTGRGQAYFALYTAAIAAPFALTGWRRNVVAGCSGAGIALAGWVQGSLFGAALNALGLGFFFIVALFAVRARDDSMRNAQLVRELQASRAAEASSAVLAERARISRELHDVLAHTLAGLSMHLEGTRKLAEHEVVSPDLLARIEQAVVLARSGLVDARQAVGALRDESLPEPDLLPSLVADFSAATGIVATFTSSGVARSLSPEARVAIFRTAQEALTNVSKHSTATRVSAVLTWGEHEVVLRVQDDGDGCAAPGPMADAGGGHGLRGMRERAELAGGRLEAGAAPGGWLVELRLPA